MKTELKFGIISGLGICVYTVVAHFLGFYSTNIAMGKYGDVVIIVLPLTVLFLAIRERRTLDGHLSVLTGLKTGLLVALISFPISTGFLWLYHHVINPNWLEFIIAYERKTMENAGSGVAEISARLDALRIGNSDLAQIIGGLIGTLVMSLILSLIISLFLRKGATAEPAKPF